jgi:hypothetical protein
MASSCRFPRIGLVLSSAAALLAWAAFAGWAAPEATQADPAAPPDTPRDATDRQTDKAPVEIDAVAPAFAPSAEHVDSVVLVTNLPPASDPEGPPREVKTWADVIPCVLAAHDDAPAYLDVLRYGGRDVWSIADALRDLRPGAVQFVLSPDTIDMDLAMDLFELCASVDCDPFADFRWGIITGRTPAAAAAFWARTIRARAGDHTQPRRVLRSMVLGGTGTGGIDTTAADPADPAFTTHHFGTRGPELTAEQAAYYENNGIIFQSGHGEPRRVAGSLRPVDLDGLDLFPAVMINGACYTGVTISTLWQAFNPRERTWHFHRFEVAPDQSLCLALLAHGLVGYIAGTWPSHGQVAIQEFETVLHRRESLGVALKTTHDYLALTLRQQQPRMARIRHGDVREAVDRRYNSAVRVLYGDPTFAPFADIAPVKAPPFAVDTEWSRDNDTAVVRVRPAVGAFSAHHLNTSLGGFGDANSGMNHRVYARIALPRTAGRLNVDLTGSANGDDAVPTTNQTWATEVWGGRRYLHLQADVPYGTLDPRRDRATYEATFRVTLR